MNIPANAEFISNGSKGIVFSIQRFSLQDGPGIRTTVFLKGCPLKCDWCSNPESQSSKPELMYRSTNCRSCGACVEACQPGAITFEDGRPRLDRLTCDLCLECVKACPNNALEVTGQIMTLEEVVHEAGQDEMFYINSGGGVTLSGGEPLSQPDFTLGLLKGCKEKGLSTALDTCGHAPWESLEQALEYADLILFDLKHLDQEKHKQKTGLDNSLILENLKRVVQSGKAAVWLRIPVIPGFNDSEEYFRDLAALLQPMPLEKISLLAYHKYGKSKYDALNRDYPPGDCPTLSEKDLEPFLTILENTGIPVSIDH